MTIKSYDFVVIGSGPGGYEAAIKASSKGLSVAVVEKNQIGGTCLNAGCIPTKTLYQSAKMLKDFKGSQEFGVTCDNVTISIEQVINRKDEVVKQLKQNIISMMNKTGVTVYYGVGSLIAGNRIHISNETSNEIISYQHCLIATGSKEFKIPIPGIDLPGVMTSKDILDLKVVPEKLVIIGGGVIGCEIASIYQQFGAKVTIIEALDRILSNQDKDISSRMKAMMKKDGIDIHTSTKVIEITEHDNELVVLAENKKGQIEFKTSQVLLAVGRKPCIEHLNLQEVGIDYHRMGIVVDENFCTTKPNVYAVGDCIGGMMLAHTASFQSFVVLDQILNHENLTNFKVTPTCIFTYPEIASVGLSEEEAKLIFGEIKVKKALYRANGKANAMGSVDGFIKVIMQQDYLVGAHILGEGASTIIHEASLMMDNKLKVSECVNSIHAHPTLSEVLLEALRNLCE